MFCFLRHGVVVAYECAGVCDDDVSLPCGWVWQVCLPPSSSAAFSRRPSCRSLLGQPQLLSHQHAGSLVTGQFTDWLAPGRSDDCVALTHLMSLLLLLLLLARLSSTDVTRSRRHCYGARITTQYRHSRSWTVHRRHRSRLLNHYSR